MNKTVNILGTEYTVVFKTEDEDDELRDANGICDPTSKRLTIISEPHHDDNVDDFKFIQAKTIRHEVVHAFMYESGLHYNSNMVVNWAMNEEMTDWIAIQAPKMVKVWQELEAL